MKCKKHPRYSGLRKPRVNCKDCSYIFKTTKKCISDAEDEIAYYKPSRAISKAMRELAKAGFSPSGHGVCFKGMEDWSMSKEYKNGYIYVSFCTDMSHSVTDYFSEEQDPNEYENKRPSAIVKIAKEISKKYDNA